MAARLALTVLMLLLGFLVPACGWRVTHVDPEPITLWSANGPQPVFVHTAMKQTLPCLPFWRFQSGLAATPQELGIVRGTPWLTILQSPDTSSRALNRNIAAARASREVAEWGLFLVGIQPVVLGQRASHAFPRPIVSARTLWIEDGYGDLYSWGQHSRRLLLPHRDLFASEEIVACWTDATGWFDLEEPVLLETLIHSDLLRDTLHVPSASTR